MRREKIRSSKETRRGCNAQLWRTPFCSPLPVGCLSLYTSFGLEFAIVWKEALDGF
jgi:hypothetical protein